MRKTGLLMIVSIMLVASMLICACGSATKDVSDGTVPSGQTETSNETKTDDVAKDVTITYCNFNSSGGNEETLNKMYEAFHEEYPNITVKIETIGYDDYFTQMQTRVAGGTAPDCYELNIENFAAYANKGLLAEITGADTSAINQTALNAFNVNGKQYGLPESFSNVVLIYNKDLFDKAGVSYPTSDWTQADLQNAAEKIRALDENTFGIWQPITYNEFFKVVAQYGGALLNEDKTEFTINSPENITAAKALVGRVTESNVQPNTLQQGGMGDWDMFMSGRLGMIPTGIWAFQTFTDNCDFAWDIAVEPGSTKKATHFFSNCVVMNPATKNPDAVATWLSWLTSSTKSADIRLAAGWDLPALADMNALSSYLEITPPDNRKAVFESLDYLVMPPVIEDYALMSDIISKYLAAAADGTMSVEDALNAAQADCEAQIKLK
ncbi:MAG: sugar ABC transporter substrate-binding protein [Lachnospiraceae bacterium]|nr:sugar ABC transporter substrate-binding protein [Lachnospiraceae bacterium]